MKTSYAQGFAHARYLNQVPDQTLVANMRKRNASINQTLPKKTITAEYLAKLQDEKSQLNVLSNYMVRDIRITSAQAGLSVAKKALKDARKALDVADQAVDSVAEDIGLAPRLSCSLRLRYLAVDFRCR